MSNNANVSPLWIACAQSNLEIAELLLDRKRGITHFLHKMERAHDDDDDDDYWEAADIDFMFWIREAPPAHGRSPFWMACANGKLALVKLLHDRGADPSEECNECVSPLEIAQRNMHRDVAKYVASIC